MKAGDIIKLFLKRIEVTSKSLSSDRVIHASLHWTEENYPYELSEEEIDDLVAEFQQWVDAGMPPFKTVLTKRTCIHCETEFTASKLDPSVMCCNCSARSPLSLWREKREKEREANKPAPWPKDLKEAIDK